MSEMINYAKHDDADRHTPPEHHHVKVIGFGAKVSNTLGHIQRPIGFRGTGYRQSQKA